MSPLIKYSVRALFQRPLAVILGISSMVLVGAGICAVSSVAVGLRTLFTGSGSENVVLVLAPKAGSDDYSRLAPEALLTATAPSEIRRHSAEVIVGVRTWTAQGNEYVRGRALDANGIKFYDQLKMIEGRPPQDGAFEFMVGATLLKNHPELAVGGKVHMIRNEFRCVGVFTAGKFVDSEIWLASTALTVDRGRPYPLSVIALGFDTPADAQAVAERLGKQRAVPVDAVVERQYYRNQMTRSGKGYYQMMLGALALLIGGSIFAVASALTMLFTRRIGDLSVLRGLGFRTRRLAMILFIETEFITLGGGMLGTVLALFALREYVGNVATGFYTLNFQASLTPPLTAAIVGTMAGIGAIAATVPIVWLTRLRVTDGLRA